MNIVKSFSIYTGISILNAGVSFLIFPILTYYLTPSDFGLMSLFSSYVSIFGTFIVFSIPGYTGVHFYNTDEKKFQLLFSSSFVLPIITFLLIEIGFVFLVPMLDNEIPSRWLLLIPVFAFLEYLYQYLLSILIMKKDVYVFTFISISKIVIELFLVYLLVIYFRFGWEGKLISWFIILQIGSIISVLFFIKKGYLVFRFDKGILMQSIMFGAPLILHSLNKFVINQSDKIFITKMVSIEDTGLYSIGYSIGMIVLILLNSVVNIYSPYLIERLSNISTEKKYQILKLSYIIVAGLLFVVIFLNFVLSPILFKYIINSRFKGGEIYVFLVSLSYVFWGLYLMFAVYIFYLKKTKILGLFAILTIFVNLLLNYILIKLNGPIGAAQSTLVSFIVLFLAVMFYSNYIYKMPWFKYKEILKVKI